MKPEPVVRSGRTGGRRDALLRRTASPRSTSFNFGDHIALGRNFGPRQEHALALRLEHFSNAGIKHPNPGENFVQLRYAYRFDQASR